MSRLPPDNIQSILEVLGIPLKIQSWRQVAALAMMLGAIIFVLIYLTSPSSPTQREFTVGTDRATTEYIEDVRKRAGADAIVAYKYSASNQELQQVFSSWGNFSSDPISEINHAGAIRQLKLGNCVKISDLIKDRSNGNKVNALVCSILQGQRPGQGGQKRLVGAIGGVYYQFPLKSDEGDYDPASFWIYQLGLDLNASR